MKRILIIGLPYFTSNVKQNMSKFDQSNHYIVLNTYYRIIDKIKFLLFLPFCHTVYSINGVIDHSFAISFSLFMKKKVVFHWVGSDVKSAINAYKSGKYKKSFIDKPVHLTDTPWYVDELKEIGINAIFQPLLMIEKREEIKPFPTVFSVLTYIPQHNQEFYGIYRLKNIAEQLPDVRFEVLGTEKPIVSMPNNVLFHGWVESSISYIQNSVVCLRVPQSDGLSFFVLEAYSQARYVVYNQRLEHAIYVQTNDDIIDRIQELKESFDNGSLKLNSKAYEWLQHEFNKEKYVNLVDYLCK